MRCALLMLVCLLALVASIFLDTATTIVEASASVVVVYNESGHGSGAIVDVNCVLTAGHVADQNDLRVRTSDGDDCRVVRVVRDPNSDLALVFIEGAFDPGHPPLRIDDQPLRVGEEITMIGTPYSRDLMNCVCHGRVVKVDYNPFGLYVNIDVLDVHGGPGCSGGPVIDLKGAIRGVIVLAQGEFLAAVPVEELDS